MTDMHQSPSARLRSRKRKPNTTSALRMDGPHTLNKKTRGHYYYDGSEIKGCTPSSSATEIHCPDLIESENNRSVQYLPDPSLA